MRFFLNITLTWIITLVLSGYVWGIKDSGSFYELNIAHINDSHSNIRPPDTQALHVDGQTIYGSLGGFSRLITLFKGLDGTPNLLKLHAGDAITGTHAYKLFEGETDAIAMNHVCFDAFIPGNHEFDFGDARLAKFLDFLSTKGPACKTPVLAANVHPGTTPPSPLASRLNGTPYFQPFVIKNIGGVDVGIFGIVVAGKTKNASKPDPGTNFEDEVIAAQRTINQLKIKGVKHIVMMSHIGYENDIAIARKLTDVDVIIGGDSHTFLGEDSSVVRKIPAGKYPTIVTNKSGDIVCIGQAWEYTKVFAKMNIKFNDDGTVQSCSGSSSLVLGEKFYSDQSLTQPLSSDSIPQLHKKLKKLPEVAIALEDHEFSKQILAYEQRYDQDALSQIGTLQGNQSLCLIRVPGSMNRGGTLCDSVVKRATGSDVAQIVAESYRKATKSASEPFIADFALTNAGGVRKQLETDGINDRPLKMEDVFTIQPFPIELIAVSITGAQMKMALEQGVANWKDNGDSDGSHPYASGLRWNLDLTQAYGSRFSNLEVKNHETKNWVELNMNATYKLVISDYLRDGSENYKIFKEICMAPEPIRCVPVGGIYAADSLADYIRSVAPGKLTRPACSDYSHQKVIKADGIALLPCQ